MSEEVMDDYDAGFKKGREDMNRKLALMEDLAYKRGLEKAFDLVGQLADFYKNNIVCGDDWSEEEKAIFKKEIQAQVNACKYAQVVIQQGEYKDEEENNEVFEL